MRLYTILYVDDVKKAVAFYEKAFGIECRFVHESGMYAEMETGSTTLAFSQYDLIQSIQVEFQKSNPSKPPFGVQITFEPGDVDRAFTQALEHGAKEVKPPQTMPWGWRCAFVRDPDGHLIELAKELTSSSLKKSPQD
jgi:uncharacterized glyoxalase superfamily protein PhnB